MADNKLELIIDVDAKKGNVEIKGVNKGLSDIEKQAVSSTKKASSGIEGMTTSMFKAVLGANAVYAAISRALRGIINIARESAKMGIAAVESENLFAVSMQSMSEEAAKWSRSLSASLGLNQYELRKSIGTFNVMLTAMGLGTQKSYEMSKGLVQLAHDFASFYNLKADEAFEKLRAGITGETEPLKRLGILVDEATVKTYAYASGLVKAGQQLTQQEKTLARYGAIMQQTSAAQGDLARTLDSPANKLRILQSRTEELKTTLGMAFLPTISTVSDELNRFTNSLAATESGMQYLAKVIAAPIMAFYSLGRAMAEVELKHAEWSLRMAKSVGGLTEQEKFLATQMRDAAKATLEWDKKIAQLEESVKSIGEFNYDAAKSAQALAAADYMAAEALDNRAKVIEKFIRDATRSAGEFRRSTEEAFIGGAAKEILEVQKEIEKLTTFIDTEGIESRVKLTAEARENIEQALQLKILKIQKDTTAEIVKDYKEAAQKRYDADVKYHQKKLEYEQELAEQSFENARQIMQFQQERAGIERDAALRRLDVIEAQQLEFEGPQTLEHKVALESRRADIEIRYLEEVHKIKTALFDLETNQIITQLNLQMEVLRLAGVNTSQISRMISEIEAQRKQLRGQLDEQTQAAIDAAKQNAIIRQNQLIRDSQQKMFDSFKRQAEGVFDALLIKSRSIFGAIGDAFKTAMLTAIKEVVTSHVARLLMQLFGGLRIPAAGGAGYGFGGGGSLGIAGTLGAMAIPGIGGGGGAGSAGVLGGLAGYGGLGASLKEFLGFGGGVQFAPGMAATWGASTLTQKLSALGRSNAALLGGATLAMLGIQRGGWSGLGMTTAGGALIGFKYGGALGAAIGGGIGALVGLFGLFRKSAEKKAREKIKATYGVDIQDKGVLQQIVEMAKQGFGGNLDMAIRSAQVADLIRLYAMTTGQSTAGLPAQMRPSTLVQTGGSLYQLPNYSNGQPIPSFGGLPGASLESASAKPITLHISLPEITVRADNAQDLLTTGVLKIVNDNPRKIQIATTVATKSNFNRRELTSLQLAPGTLTS